MYVYIYIYIYIYTHTHKHTTGLCKNASFLPFGGQRSPEHFMGDTSIKPTYRNLKLGYLGDEKKKEDAEQDVVMGTGEQGAGGVDDPKAKMEGILKLDGCVCVCLYIYIYIYIYVCMYVCIGR